MAHHAIGWPAAPVAAADRITPSPFAVEFVTAPQASGLSAAECAELLSVPAGTRPGAEHTFPLSVASGDPRAHGIVLWTRLATETAHSAGTPEIRSRIGWQIAAHPDFAPEQIVLAGVAHADETRDATVKLAIDNTNLEPFTTYYYRFIHAGTSSRTGRFKTLPDTDADLARLRLGQITCQDYNNGFFTALGHLADEDIDYVVHLGDYVYATLESDASADHVVRAAPPLPGGGRIPADLADYRHLYRVYHGDAHLQRLHERVAMIQLWDDHEYGNDVYQAVHPDYHADDADRGRQQPALRAAANQAWSEYGVADVWFDAATHDWQEARLYRRFKFGALADLLCTDERLFRDAPPCGLERIGGRYASWGCDERVSQTRSMLGAEQYAWLVDGLVSSAATWTLWANEVMFMPLTVGPLFVNLDQWDGFPAERQRILDAVAESEVTNLVLLTGDLHTFLAGEVYRDFARRDGPPLGVELMVGSVSAANVADNVGAGLNLPSSGIPAHGLDIADHLLNAPLIRQANPHLKFWDSSTHGYSVIELTPERLSCRYMTVDDVGRPGAEHRELQRFAVAAGSSRLRLIDNDDELSE